MRRLVIRIIVACLAFAIGISALGIWEHRQSIIDACAQFFTDYQN